MRDDTDSDSKDTNVKEAKEDAKDLSEAEDVREDAKESTKQKKKPHVKDQSLKNAGKESNKGAKEIKEIPALSTPVTILATDLPGEKASPRSSGQARPNQPLILSNSNTSVPVAPVGKKGQPVKSKDTEGIGL